MNAIKPVYRIARFGLTTANASRLAQFYEDAFGCRRDAVEHAGGPDFETLMNVRGGAQCIRLRLGHEIIELVQFEYPGRPYPAYSPASDLIFQHFAIVVSNMNEAWTHLCAVGGWSAITQGGPQHLPESSGDVTAFKFRDPEGHPLELLSFPAGKAPPRWQGASRKNIFLGIDHSALCIADSAVSRTFYEGLGFTISAHAFNCGPEQERLDDLPGARVEVTALAPRDIGPHIELLCYRGQTRHPPVASKSNDTAATRLVLELCGRPTEGDEAPRAIQDPDAHRLIIIPAISICRDRNDA